MTSERELMLHIAGTDDSWLGGYVNYARTLTDAPLAFHVGAGLVALAGAVGSSVAWKGGGRENWPNLYALLLAPSGLYRKSTSVDLACSFLERAAPGRVMDNEFSPERFIKNLAEHPNAVLKEAEFSSLLERMKANYMSGLKQRLTELYDCVPRYSRHISGDSAGPQGQRLVIDRPALSIVAASTTDWLVSSITELDLRSGFIPRFLLIPAAQKEAEPEGGYWAHPDTYAEGLLLRELAQRAHRPYGVVEFRDVRDQLIGWSNTMTRRIERGEFAEELSGMYSRISHHLGKLCALLAVSELPAAGEYRVSRDMAERSCALLEWVIEGSERTFEQHLVFSKFERQAQKLLAYVSAHGGEVNKSQLLKNLHLPAREMDQLLGTLRERGEVDTESRPSGGRLQMVVRRLADAKEAKEGEGQSERSPLNGHLPEVPPAYSQAWNVQGGAAGP